MNAMIRGYRSLPMMARYVIAGTLALGILGAIAGLIQGLRTYVPTAWFAVIEIGLPAAVAGATLGLLAALVVAVRRRAQAPRH